MYELKISTPRQGFIDITGQVAAVVRESSVKQGICQVFVPHTTAAVTINENADPDVITDMLEGLEQMVPKLNYRHIEGNSPAHIKSSLLGSNLTVAFENNTLQLGTWQGIYFCEFDGPRSRKVWIQLVGR